MRPSGTDCIPNVGEIEEPETHRPRPSRQHGHEMTVMTSSWGDVVPQPAPEARRSQRLQVAIASDLSLIAEAVGAALASRMLEVTLLAWPGASKDDPVHRQLARIEPDVALLIFDVDMSIRMAQAAALIRECDVPWVVLTSVSAGATWGGLREAGASSVRPSVTGLDEIERLIVLLSEGGIAPCAEELEGHLRTWRATQARIEGLQERLNRLTPRELQVLDLLRTGLPVRSIASRLGLSESTVRSQVRSVLHKLDVRSQLAAVALLRATDYLD
jgi:DNA-binding NarL/FixJ family response regulator